MSGVDVPLLAGTTLTNELVVRDVVERVIASRHRRVGILGLSFKTDTDDLRESPNVELAERLIGKGFDVRIYDPIINPERLVGANLRHVEAQAAAPQPAARRARRRRRWPTPRWSWSASSDPGLLAALLAATTALRAAPGHRPARTARRRRREDSPATRAWDGDAVRSGARASSSSSRTCTCRSTGGCGWSASPCVAAGYDVTVVCPRGKDSKPYEVIDGVDGAHLPSVRPGRQRARVRHRVRLLVPRHRPAGAQGAPQGGRSTVVQACNPPDIFWPLARWLRLRDGSKFVFDHHDLCPELYESRFPDGASAAASRAAVPRADDLPHRGPGHLHQRVLRRRRRTAGAQASRARHRRADRARPGQADARCPRTRPCAAAARTSWPTSG